MEHYANILAEFQSRMTLREAERRYGLMNGELGAAIAQGKIRYYKAGKSSRRGYQVSPAQVAEYIERYRTFQNDLLPS